jgi:hypothetical protein
MRSIFLAFLVGVLFALLPPNLFEGDPGKLLMPFLGLLMAGIFPAISLTISSIKAGGFSVQRVAALADELSQLLDYLQTLFVMALVAAITLVAGEIAAWGDKFPYAVYSARIFNLILGTCFAVLVGALPRIRRTFAVLLSISRAIAIDEAEAKVRGKMAALPPTVDRFPTKEKFGELFEATNLNPPTGTGR